MTGQPAALPPVAWSGLAAGPATVESLLALNGVAAGTLTGAELVDAVLCAEKAISRLVGVQARLPAALAVPFVAGDPTRLAATLARRSGLADDEQTVQALIPDAAQSLAAAEVAAALRIAPVTAGVRVRDAVALTGELAPARQALEDGLLDRGKLRAVVEQVQVLPPDRIGAVLDQVLAQAPDRCTSELREIAASAVITADPAGAADRHHQSTARRDLTLTPGTDAMATLKAFLPADGAVKIFQVSDLLATATAGVAGDPRGIGARRVDALVDLADRLLSDGHIDLTGFFGPPHPPGPVGTTRATDPTAVDQPTSPGTPDTDPRTADPKPADPSPADPASAHPISTGPSHRPGGPARTGLTRQGRRPHLTVTLCLDTLAGLNDLPATLAGYGSIPAGLARSIATSAATITDPTTGARTATGSLTYRPRQAPRDHATTHTCQFPFYRQPAWRCDLDHRDPFDHHHTDQGGPTTTDNTGPLCRRHHLFKSHTGWHPTVDTTRLVINWTSPTGHTYRRRPRATTPPAAWIQTTATNLAHRLDAHAHQLNQPDEPHRTLHERLTDVLLHHALTQPRPIEYDPTPTRPDTDTDGRTGTGTGGPTSTGTDQADSGPTPPAVRPTDDEPPF